MAPVNYLDQLATHDAILLGAIGHPEVQDHITLNGLLLPIRRRIDQDVCLSPSYLFPGIDSSLCDKSPGSIDILVFRENTEGEYTNVGGRLHQHSPQDIVIQTATFTRRGYERIIRAAFERVASRPKRQVAAVTKSNALGYGMVLWDQTFAEVAAEFPEIETESLLIDRAVMEFLCWLESFDLVVASNLFGNILTDLAAIVVGSMRLTVSTNIDPTYADPSMFEPVHGSALDIAGQGIANPLAAILSAALMLDHLRLYQAARSIHDGVKRLLAKRGPRTPDLGGHASTTDIDTAVAELIENDPNS